MICVSKKKSYLKSQNLKIFGQGNLHGKVEISGAKNSALVLLASSLLTNEKIILENVPRLTDIEKMGNILKSLGIKIIQKKSWSFGDDRLLNDLNLLTRLLFLLVIFKKVFSMSNLKNRYQLYFNYINILINVFKNLLPIKLTKFFYF